MIINHNMASLNTYNKLSSNTSSTAKSLEKLSSGLRINKAGDDAAGLAISEKMRGQIRGLDQATRNAQDGISLIQTAEGSLSETQSILQRMKELATQSANDTNVTADRSEIQKELNQLTSEINRIGNTTEFNTQKLLKGKDVAVVATAQDVATTTAGVAGVAVGTTSELAVNAKSIVAVASSATVQGNTAAATGRIGVTDQTTVSLKGTTSAAIVSGLTFTSTTPSSEDPNGITININQLVGNTGTASTITSTGSGSSKVINFNIGTGADGKTLFTGTNRGELANYLKGIDSTAYAATGITITVPEDPNANGPASAEKLINMPSSTAVATASTIYSGSLSGGVTEVQGVSTFSIESVIKEAGDTVTVGGKTFTAKASGANVANGEFNITGTHANGVAGSAVSNTTNVTFVQQVTTSGAITAVGVSDTLSFDGMTVSVTSITEGAGTAASSADGTTVALEGAAAGATDAAAIADAFNKQVIASGKTAADYGVFSADAGTGVKFTAAEALGDTYAAKPFSSTGTASLVPAYTTPGVAVSLSIKVDGTDYTLKHADLAKTLNGTQTNSSVLDLVSNATDASGNKLGDKALVAIDSAGKLNVTSLTAGTGGTVAFNSYTDTTLGTKVATALGIAAAGIASVAGKTTTTGVASLNDQAISLIAAVRADTTLNAHYTSANTANGQIQLTERATTATGTDLAQVTTAGAGANDKLNITDLSGKNLSQITIVRGSGVDVAGFKALSSKLDTSLQLTSGTASAELNGVKISFAELTNGTTVGGTASSLATTWDAATRTLNVTGAIGDAASKANFQADLQDVVRAGLTNAGFKGGALATVTAGATDAASGGTNEIAAVLNGNSITFGSAGLIAPKSNTLDTSFTATSAVVGSEFDGVNISFGGLTTSASATALTSEWDATTNTLHVTGNLVNTLNAGTIKTALQTAIQAGMTASGEFSTAGIADLTFANGGSATTAAALTAFNGKSVTLNTGAGSAAISAHSMVVDQQDGNLTITLSDTTPNSNTAAKIQTAVQDLGIFKSTAGDVDFSKYQFTAEGNWDAKATGEDIVKSNTTLVGGTKEVKGDYSFDITKAFVVGDKVNIKGQIFTAVASGAIGSKNEFDVSAGNVNNQAISLRNAIGLNSVLSGTYTVSGTGANIKMTELQATGVDLKTTDLAVKATGTAGEYTVDTKSQLLENGAAFVVDGVEIKVSNKNANVGYANGTAVKESPAGILQSIALRNAINSNAELKVKYTASVAANGQLVLKQNEMEESATAPVVATKNSSIGQFTSSLQIGANSGQSMTVDVGDMRSASLGISGDGSVDTVAAKNGKVASYVETANTTDGTNNTSVEYSLDVSTHEKATNAISVLDDAIQAVSAERSKLGAFQNRLEHTISNLGTSSENLTGAESRIRDVDMAKEMMQFQKNNILAQAATAMLAQANQQPQGVLQLLR